MPRIGLVLELDEEKGLAYISTSRRGVCDGCGDSSSCSLEGGGGSETAEVVTAKNKVSAHAGDTVEFDLEGHTELKISLIVWIGPLLGLFTGAFTGSGLAQPLGMSEDAGTLLGAVLGFLIAYGMVMVYDRLIRNDSQLKPSILRVLTSSCSIPPPTPKSMDV
jgi:sigma-E factor negative regulatory protein RseC